MQNERLAPVLSFVNAKGGTAKTTTTVNLAAEFGAQGFNVLVIDVDPQANASLHIGVKHPGELPKNASLLFRGDMNSICTAIQESVNAGFANVHLIPGSLELDQSVEDSLRGFSPRPYEEMRQRITPLRQAYDLILIDCPPSLRLLTGNALAASTHYLVPIETSSQYPTYGVRDISAFVGRIKQSINPDLVNVGALLTRHDERRNACKAIADTVRDTVGVVIPVTIRASTKVSESSIKNAPVRKIDPSGGVTKDFEDLATFLIGALGLATVKGKS